MTFKAWYTKQGFKERVNTRDRAMCAELLDISERHVNSMLSGSRNFSGPTRRLCEYIDYFGRMPVDKKDQ